MDFSELERQDGVRFAWNCVPNSKQEAQACIVPISFMYSPVKQLQDMQLLQYQPVRCKLCQAALNPYVVADFANGSYACPFCHKHNSFPPSYSGISNESKPAEMFTQYSTIEYTLPDPPVLPPAYMFVVDTCMDGDELAALKSTLLQEINLIPDYCMLALITFGTHVHVHELGAKDCVKQYVLKGNKEYTPTQVAKQLRLQTPQPGGGRGGPQAPPAPPPGLNRFLMRLADCDMVLTEALEGLQKDPFPVISDHRPARCTGTALQVASALIAQCVVPGKSAAHVMLFTGGPCTVGPSKVVSDEFKEEIRSHKDLVKDAAPHHEKALQAYNELADQMIRDGITCHILACSLEQVGFLEMKRLYNGTGGYGIQSDTFRNNVFRDSLRILLQKQDETGHLQQCSNATVEIITSRELKVQGMLGPGATLQRPKAQQVNVSDHRVGLGGTTCWTINNIDSQTSLAFVLEVARAYKDASEAMAALQTNPYLYIQIITAYRHWSGDSRMRVTSLYRPYSDGSSHVQLVSGFDQEAAAVIVARIAAWRMAAEEGFEPSGQLDRDLIKLAQRFGEYSPGAPQTFQLHAQMQYYPQFMFNLRRSQFIQVFGHSPDESTLYSSWLLRSPVQECILMIEPSLKSYEMSQPPAPVHLDASSVKPDVILLMDGFFSVVVFHGEHVAQWRDAGYAEQEGYEAFKEQLEAGMAEADDICGRRFPVPRRVNCDQNKSQARFLLAKLNPSNNYQEDQGMGMNNNAFGNGEVIYTDDVSLSVFYDHLVKLAVQD